MIFKNANFVQIRANFSGIGTLLTYYCCTLSESYDTGVRAQNNIILHGECNLVFLGNLVKLKSFHFFYFFGKKNSATDFFPWEGRWFSPFFRHPWLKYDQSQSRWKTFRVGRLFPQKWHQFYVFWWKVSYFTWIRQWYEIWHFSPKNIKLMSFLWKKSPDAKSFSLTLIIL